VAAEGVPIARERYSAIGKRRRMLHQSPIFRGGDIYDLVAGAEPVDAPALERLRVTETLADTLMTIPPFTMVRSRFVRQCAAAISKVADEAASSVSGVGGDREQRQAPSRAVAG
jgi:hypothetical protein